MSDAVERLGSGARHGSPPPKREARRDAGARDAGRRVQDLRAEAIRPVLEAGQRVFGENRVQEAQAKWPALKAEFPDIELHLIGPLQSNKAKEAVALSTSSRRSTATRSPPRSPPRSRGRAGRRGSTFRSTPARSRRRPASSRARPSPSSRAAARCMAWPSTG